MPRTPEENSTISSAWTFLKPHTRPIPSPTLRTRPVSSTFPPTEVPEIRFSRIDDTSEAAAFAVAYERAAEGFGTAAKEAALVEFLMASLWSIVHSGV